MKKKLKMPLHLPILNGLTGFILLGIASFFEKYQSVGKGIEDPASLLCGFCYIGGVVFCMHAVLKLKEHIDEIEELDKTNKKNILDGVFSTLDEKMEMEKEVQPVYSSTENKNFINMDDAFFNKKIVELIQKIDNLLLIDTIKNDVENRTLLENTKCQYLPKIALQFKTIPIGLRKERSNNKLSPYDIAVTQINLITNCVSKIEKIIVEDQTKEMRVMSRFLETKFLQEQNVIEIEIEKELNA